MLKYASPHPLSDSLRAEYLAFAIEIARVGGAATLPYFRTSTVVENKLTDGQFDPVTEADKAAEKIIRESISDKYPAHGIFGEEFGHQEGNGLTWVIDPVDGTRAFMSGLLHWGVLVALFDGERPVIGVMYQPFTDELFFGDGRIAEYRRGASTRVLRVSGCTEPSDAVLTTTSPRWIESKARDGFDSLENLVKLTLYGGDCYLYGVLAMGYVDLVVDGNLAPYDIQAHIPIIEGAGGLVTTVEGADASMGGIVLASASETLHQRALVEFSR